MQTEKEYLTIKKMADTLNINPSSIVYRIRLAGVKPIRKVGNLGLYSMDTLDKISVVKIDRTAQYRPNYKTATGLAEDGEDG